MAAIVPISPRLDTTIWSGLRVLITRLEQLPPSPARDRALWQARHRVVTQEAGHVSLTSAWSKDRQRELDSDAVLADQL